MLNLSKPKIIFVSPTNYQNYCNVLKKTTFVEKLIVYDGNNKNLIIDTKNYLLFSNFFDIDVGDTNRFNCELQNMKDRVALILCSSGTTGLPKGVQITQFNVIVACAQFR